MSNHSTFSNFSKPEKSIPLSKIAEDIQAGKYKDKITFLRELSDPKIYSEEKKKLPSFTPSGVFKDHRRIENISEYSNLVHLDYDNLNEEEVKHVKELLGDDKYVHLAFVSPSGKGVKVFIKVEGGKEAHRRNVQKVKNHYDTKLGFKADKNCKDLPRLCFLSHDPSLIYRPNSERYIQVATPNEKEIIKLYNEIDQQTPYEEGQRNTFIFKLGVACYQVNIPLSDCLSFCFSRTDLSDKEIETTIKSAYSGNYKSNPAIRMFSGKLNQVEMYLSGQYVFRLNEITGRVEVKINGETEFKVVNEVSENNFIRELEGVGITISTLKLRTILYSGFSYSFNPFKSYLHDLPAWDGFDYIGEYLDLLPVKNKETAYLYFRRWMIGYVASLLIEEKVNQHVLVLIGNQGIGKTTWLNSLVPEELMLYAHNGLVDPKNKDTYVYLSECCLIIMDELDSIGKQDVGRLKDIITKPRILVRKPYKHSAEAMPRRASFAASVNHMQFLHDTTGSRRFLCIELEGDINMNHVLDINKVFSQALALFRAGNSFGLTKKK